MQEQNNNTTDNNSDTKPLNLETTSEQNKDIPKYDDWGNEIRD